MSDYRHGSHTVFSIQGQANPRHDLHIVWITKYRRKVLRGEVAERIREIVREECRKSRVEMLRGPISTDHVHIMVSIPPQVTISRLIQRIKGKSSYLLFNEFPALRKRFWGRHFWARSYCCRSSGNVTDEVVKAYIEGQDRNRDDVFRIEGESSPTGDTPIGETPLGDFSPEE
jgi:putative transposase